MSLAAEPTYTLSDLERWPVAGVPLAVIGRPISHSLSPVMHNAALAELGKTKPEFRRWHYHKFDISPDELAAALELFRHKGFHGLNLTVPHKTLVVPHLKSQDPFVRASGAANTLKIADGGWFGCNTDGIGLTSALRDNLEVSLKGSNVILLGAGGAARAAAVECLAAPCASLWIGNRTAASLAGLLESLAGIIPASGSPPVTGFDPKHPPAALRPGSIVINATSLGLKPDDESPLDLTRIPRPAQVFDMIYRPAETALLRHARALEIKYANGLSMLVYQGARSLELWSGETAPTRIMHQAVRSALRSP